MPETGGLGKMLMVIGGILLVVGAILAFAGKLPGSGGISWLGRLPGDILIKRENFTFYFPLTTSILISVILTVLLYLLTRR